MPERQQPFWPAMPSFKEHIYAHITNNNYPFQQYYYNNKSYLIKDEIGVKFLPPGPARHASAAQPPPRYQPGHCLQDVPAQSSPILPGSCALLILLAKSFWPAFNGSEAGFRGELNPGRLAYKGSRQVAMACIADFASSIKSAQEPGIKRSPLFVLPRA
jgi:hypothetical protein